MNIKSPLKIGITGGIGSGKTTVSSILEKLGTPVFNSDEYGKYLLKTNKIVIKKIIQEFGRFVVENNKISTKDLSSIVFSNKKKLAKLNHIIHPHVLNKFETWAKSQNTKYIIKESAILFESKTYSELDKIILVKAPLKTRITRVCNRDNRTKEEVQKIINNQIQENKILKYVDYIINNNNNSLLTPKVIELHTILSKL